MKKIAFKRNRKERATGLKPALWLVPLLVCLLGCSLPVYSQNIESDVSYKWVKQAGGINQWAASDGLAVDASGNSYIAGRFQKTATFGTTTLTSNAKFSDLFITRLDAAGNFLWAKQQPKVTGSNDGCSISGIAADASGSCYMTGTFNGTITLGSITLTSKNGGAANLFIAKLDSNGNFLWAKQPEVSNNDQCSGYGIAVDASGNSYVTGKFKGTVTFGVTTLTTASNSNFENSFITKLDPAGNFTWTSMIDYHNAPTGEFPISGVAVDPSGNCYITGNFMITATFGSINLTSKSRPGFNDMFIAKLDATGHFLWVKQVEGEANLGNQYGIAVDASGNSYVTGSIGGAAIFGSTTLTGKGVFITKLDTKGNFLWAKTPVNNSTAFVSKYYSIAADASGNSYVTGNFTTGIPNSGATIIFGSDTLSGTSLINTFITKLDVAGNFLWAQHIADSSVFGGGIATDTSGNCYVTGAFMRLATFDSTTLTTDDGHIFICKLSEHGGDEGLGITKHNPSGTITLLPNPFCQNIHLQLDLQKAANAAISVYDLTGRQVYRLEDQKLPEGKSNITLSPAFENVPTGIYLVNVQLDNGEKWIRKVVKLE